MKNETTIRVCAQCRRWVQCCLSMDVAIRKKPCVFSPSEFELRDDIRAKEQQAYIAELESQLAALRSADAERGGVMNKFSTIGWLIGFGYAEKKTKKYIAVVWGRYHVKWKWKIYERTILDSRGAVVSQGSRKVRWECLRLAETQLIELGE